MKREGESLNQITIEKEKKKLKMKIFYFIYTKLESK